MAAGDTGHVTEAFVCVSASTSSRCLTLYVLTRACCRDWAVCLRKAAQAHRGYFHASSTTFKTIIHYSLGVETIERELKMLEEVHKGETYPLAQMLLFAFHDHVSVLFLRCITRLCRRSPRKEQRCFPVRLRAKR